MSSRTGWLFLDVDGVLIPFGDSAIAPHCADNLCLIMREMPGLGLVISSTWRFPPLVRLLKIWRQAGLSQTWISGCTPDLAGSPGQVPDTLRGSEIRHWLDERAQADEAYAIIDDQTDEIRPCFPASVIFRCNPQVGITRDHALAIVRLLRGTGR